MRRWWDELLVDIFDRLQGFVRAHPARLDPDERDEAVQRALMKFSKNLINTYEGVSWGELVNATRRLTGYVCVDVQRESIRRRERIAGSFDDGWNSDATDGGGPGWEAELRDLEERKERQKDAGDFVDWALPKVGASRRAVLELTFHGASTAEICEQLGLTVNNMQQLRSRGFKDLAKLKEQYG